MLGKVPYIISAWTEEVGDPLKGISDAMVILTDEDHDALRLATDNAQKCGGKLECRSLDWRDPHNFVLDGPVGLIVASDCIYSSESIPHLVQAISSLVQRSSDVHKQSLGPKIIVSTKRRHPSEVMFFELMTKFGFEQLEHQTMPMHDHYRESTEQDLEAVDIHIYERRVK
ncbi:MAG: hypothetical protein Q9219_000106 [cf. Caloplaca sp. 3 TL-2023]